MGSLKVISQYKIKLYQCMYSYILIGFPQVKHTIFKAAHLGIALIGYP